MCKQPAKNGRHRRLARIGLVHRPVDPGVLLTVIFPSSTLESFIQTFYPDVLQDGIFIRASRVSSQLVPNAPLRLRFLLANRKRLLSGSGRVAWIRRRGDLTGVGIRFGRLTAPSELIFQAMLEQRALLIREATLRARLNERREGGWADEVTQPFGPPPLRC